MIIENSGENIEINENNENTQTLSVTEIQKKIEQYKDKERAYKLQLEIKNKKIEELIEIKKYYEYLVNINTLSLNNTSTKYDINQIQNNNLFFGLLKLISKKNTLLISLEEELYSSNAHSEDAEKYFKNKFKKLQKDNMEIYNYITGSTIENFKKDNNNEKNQLNALLYKISECNENIENCLRDLDNINDTSSMLLDDKFNK